MFNLYYANDADRLAEALAERMAIRSGDDLLVPEIVLVPQFGLRRWLEIRLAEIGGIIANVEFYAPAEYAWRLLRAANPNLPETSVFERNVLRWRIFAELPALASRFEMPGSIGDQPTRLRFATELAQLFERYLAYRSDLLSRWETGTDPRDWQAELWRRLTRNTAEPHRAHLLADAIKRYNADTPPPDLPKRLFAFACTDISPDLLRFYGAVARHCAVDFLMPNPCREYWGDVRSEREALRTLGADAFTDADNPLLAGYGRAGRNFVAQLFSYDIVQTGAEIDLSRAPQNDSLLHRIQTDILDLQIPRIIGASPDDDSLQFHVCHSRLREVQVLHDQLLDLFQRDPTLTPRDVAIMTPDIANYAPCIDAVFGGIAPTDARFLPYAISDNAPQDSHALIAFASQLLALPLARMSVAEFLALLSVPAIARKFDLDSARISQIETWLRDTGVRWGFDAAHHNEAGAGNYREFSWEFGLERLVLGYASGDESALLADIAPDAAVEGTAAETLGVVLRVLGVLRSLRAQQSQSHSATTWQDLYNTVLDDLLQPDDTDRNERRALDAIHNALASLADQTRLAGVEEPLDWQCVRDFVGDRLAEPERSYRFFSGGISVCGMIPLRAVPFRILCLIGMGAETFPRRDRHSALSRAPRGGERSERDDDRYLFLQLLIAARDVFYCSWIGEEQRDGTAREPSAVVSELIDVVAQRYFSDECTTRRHLVARHPMQPFSPQNFGTENPRIFSYRGEWRAAASITRSQAAQQFFDDVVAAVVAHEDGEVDLDELRAFFQAPARIFLRDKLGTALDATVEKSADEDPLSIDGLHKYTLRRFLTDAALSGGADTPPVPGLRARALVPIGAIADRILAAEQSVIDDFARTIRANDIASSAIERFELSLLDGRRLSGRLPPHDAGRAFRWRAGSFSDKHLLNAWIDFLAFAANVENAEMNLLGIDDRKIESQRFAGIDRLAARHHLSTLVAFFDAGMNAPLLFFPRTSLAYVECFRKQKNVVEAHEDALEVARKTFERSRHTDGEAARAVEFGLIARDLDIFDANSRSSRTFADTAIAICGPMLDALESS